MKNKEERITCIDDHLPTMEEIDEKLKDVPKETLDKIVKRYYELNKEERVTCLDDRLLTTEEIKEKLKDVPEEILEKFRKEAEEYKKRHGIKD